MYTVYKIEVNEVCLYIRHTSDLKKREYQHNYLLKKGKDKELYNYLRSINVDRVQLIPLQSYKKKTDAKRLEMFLILSFKFLDLDCTNPIFDSWFTGNKNVDLKQKIPNLSDR